MASAAPRYGRNEPEAEPQPIIVKKITAQHRHVHHGGQWKVAYADFVTAMMAFFMLLWLISTTDEDKRHGIADYFSPTLLEMKQDSAGSKGLLGGESLSEQKLLHRSTSGGAAAIALPRSITAGGRRSDAEAKAEDRKRFQELRQALEQRIDNNAATRGLKTHVRFTETPEGLRIDLVDEADFSMFRIGTDRLVPQALKLVREVSAAIAGLPNAVIVRGHTDALPYADGQVMNNWMLSTARAEATRMALNQAGTGDGRFERIEGVADTQPFNPADRYDPRNRRMSITLAWTGK
jgi:chemotaxis protein MotB